MQDMLAQVIWPAIAGLVAVIVAGYTLSHSESAKFKWMDFWYGFPLIGKLRGLAKDPSRSKRAGWMQSEEALCADYAQYVHLLSETEFNKRTEYLRKAFDIGRHPMGLVGYGLLGLLLAAEALGFSYLLSTWVAKEGSANTYTLMSFAIAFVIAGIFAYIMHNAGHQWYVRRLSLVQEKAWRTQGPEERLVDHTIKLDSDQSVDDRKPVWQQVFARVEMEKGLGWVIGAVLAVAVVSVGSTYMRIKNLDASMISETTATQTAGNPFASGAAVLPDDVAKPQQEADQRAHAEKLEAEKGEGLAAFIMLAAIFVFTQLVGFISGFKYSLASREGKSALFATLGCTTYQDYERLFAPRMNRAKARLSNLQQLLVRNALTAGVKPQGDFEDFLHQQAARKRSAQSRADAAVASDVQAHAAQAAVLATAPVLAAAPVAAPASPAPELVSSLDEALRRLDTLADKQQKESFVLGLPTELRGVVIAEVRRRKAAEEEVKDLF